MKIQESFMYVCTVVICMYVCMYVRMYANVRELLKGQIYTSYRITNFCQTYLHTQTYTHICTYFQRYTNNEANIHNETKSVVHRILSSERFS